MKVICHNCEDKDALYYCPECNEKQCQDCLDSLHVGKRKSHLPSLKTLKENPLLCDNCSEKDAAEFCSDCNEKQCETCLASLHVGKRRSHLNNLKSVDTPYSSINLNELQAQKERLAKEIETQKKELERLWKEKQDVESIGIAKMISPRDLKQGNLEKLMQGDSSKNFVAKETLPKIQSKSSPRSTFGVELKPTNLTSHASELKEELEHERERKRQEKESLGLAEQLTYSEMREKQFKAQSQNSTSFSSQKSPRIVRVELDKSRVIRSDIPSKLPSGIKTIVGKREHATTTSIIKNSYGFSSVSGDQDLMLLTTDQHDAPAQLYLLKDNESVPAMVETFSCDQNDKFFSIGRVLKSQDLVALGYSNGRVDVFQWNVKSGKKKLGSVHEHRLVEVSKMLLTSDGRVPYLFTVGHGKTSIIQMDPIRCYKMFEYQQVAPISSMEFVFCCLHPDEDRETACLISAQTDGTLSLYECSGGKEIGAIQAHEKAIEVLLCDQMKLDEDLTDLIFTGCHDGSIGVWNMNLKNLGVLRGHAKEITCLDSDSEMNRLVSGSVDKQVLVWSIASFECIYVFQPHDFVISHVTIKNHLVYTVDEGGVVGQYDLEKEQCLDLIVCHNVPVDYLYVHHGRVITGSDSDQTLKMNGIGKTRVKEVDV